MRENLGNWFAGFVLCALTIPMAQAAVIEVAQESSAGSGDFDANILGNINTYNTTGTNAQYYAYNTTYSTSFCDGAGCTGRPVLTSEASHLFLVDASDGLGLFIVHDKPDSDANGGAANMTITLDGDTASVLVSDDTSEFTSASNTIFTDGWRWSGCCTDGAVIGTLDGNWTALVDFNSFTDGLTQWGALSSGASTIPLALVADRRVRLRPVDDNGGGGAGVPAPATLGLLALGLAGMGFAGKKRKT